MARLEHQKLAEDKLAAVMEHVRSIPTVTSHYSHETSPNVQYYQPEIKIKQQLYDLHKTWLPETHPGMDFVTFHYYVDVLRKHFCNLSFVQPKSDTCKQCDMFNVKMNDPTLDKNMKSAVEAVKGYDMLREMLQAAGDDVMVVCMDLQQALPIPKLSNGIAFY